MQEQLDRIERKLDDLIAKLTNKQSPFDREDDAPDPIQPVVGFERVFGPRPKDATALSLWRDQVKRTGRVYEFIPDEYEPGAMILAAKTGVLPIFLFHEGEDKAAITTGSPKAWLVQANRFIGSNIEGLIRVIEDAK